MAHLEQVTASTLQMYRMVKDGFMAETLAISVSVEGLRTYEVLKVSSHPVDL